MALPVVGPRVIRGRLACLLACAAISAACPAFADDPDPSVEARQQYQQGTKAFSGKKYAEAALHFENAAALKPSAIALYTAALAWDLASRPERAADAFARSLDVPGLDEKQTNTAKERLASLEKSLGTAEVKAPDGWKVQLDTFTEVKAPAKLHGAPGVHSLSVRAPGKPIEKRDITLEAGKTAPLELKEEPKPEPKVEEPPKKEEPPKVEPLPPRLAHPFWTTPKVIGVGVAGVGVAALAGAIVLGLNAKDAESAYQSAPTRPAFDHASSLQTWTNVSIIAGAALVAGGIALVVVPIGEKNERSMHASVTPGGLALGGKF
ncbi:MAG: hypothetical protein U0270_09925 [Labilithrix sp.]